jgi:SOS response regulatory protein OraA/RecX
LIASIRELRVKEQQLKSLEVRIVRLRRELKKAGVESAQIEQALQALKDEWSERKEEIGKYGRRSVHE